MAFVDENDPSVPPTFQNYCKGIYKMDFALIADRIESELNYYGINQATFAHFVVQRSQTRFSELLTEARTEEYFCRSKGVFEIYRRMESWLKQPTQERINAYNQWLQERGHGSKKKGFIKKSADAMVLKLTVDPPPNITTVYVNERGEIIEQLVQELPPQMSAGEFRDQGDAKWIVIRGQLRGHNDTPSGRIW
jgi:hypothetical protein